MKEWTAREANLKEMKDRKEVHENDNKNDRNKNFN